jgi:predicted RND superfamily exporter protein
MLTKVVKWMEAWLFSHRALTLGAIAALTAFMGFFAAQLKMDAGYEKQMPIGHEYVQTYERYKDSLFGPNRLTFVVRARSGTIWTQQGLSRLYDVTQAVFFLPNVDRLGVTSLWTPNSVVNEITEEGFRADPIIDGRITPNSLTPERIAKIQRATSEGGFVGTLVSRDQTSAMVTAELLEVDRDGKRLDYIPYNHFLDGIRAKFEDSDFEIQIIGFAKQVGDIADGASQVLVFCGIALLLTALAVYWYCHSVRFTILPIACSLTSLVWQFGTLRLLGYGLDPLAVLVPFLVFAIGVSHGVQQINYIVRDLAQGRSSMEAARDSFTGLLIPGTLALITAFVSFATLILIPIPMVRELAITASIGVAYKIVTNLILLPVVASCVEFSQEYAANAMKRREQRAKWLKALAGVARPGNALIVVSVAGVVLGVSIYESRDRVIGTLQPGAPELRPESRFNRDAVSISKNYGVGLDWLSIVIEAPRDSCENLEIAQFEGRFSWAMQHVPGVLSVASFSNQLATWNEGYNEGNPKMAAIPIDQLTLSSYTLEIARDRGYVNKDCTMRAVHLFLTDHKAVTINFVIDAVKRWRAENQLKGVTVRLAAGNDGVIAATNDEVAKSELPMMLYVYAAIVTLVFLTYRDVRGVVACCLPLTIGTFIGYWFMKELDIGLTVATLPVMVLAVGIGVDYAFYIYNRLQLHLAQGEEVEAALEHSILEVGMATIFTAITLAIGVATWVFSPLKFQADMGKLLSFMFIVNLVMAMTTLPAITVLLGKWFPRRGPVHAPGFLDH